MNTNEAGEINKKEYKEELTKLIKIYKKKGDEVIAKYPDYKGSGEHDGAPYSPQLKRLSLWMSEETRKLKEKYGIPCTEK